MSAEHVDPIGADDPVLEKPCLFRIRIKAEFVCDLTQGEIAWHVRRLEGPMSQMTATNGLIVAPLDRLDAALKHFLETQQRFLLDRLPTF